MQAMKRLNKEFKFYQKSLDKQMKDHGAIQDNFVAAVDEFKYNVWHFLVFGLKDEAFSKGFYLGNIEFPVEYPQKPPKIRVTTPNGRFKTGESICLSISEHHPESWDPMWNATTIINGLISVMEPGEQPWYNWVNEPVSTIEKLAKQSKKKVSESPIYQKHFTQYSQLVGIEQQNEKEKPEDEQDQIMSSVTSLPTQASSQDSSEGHENMEETKEEEKLEEFDEREYSCSLCFGIFDNPATLECGHSFCFKCLQLQIGQNNCKKGAPGGGKKKKKAAQNNGYKGCPYCKQEIKEDIKVNKELVSKMEQLGLKTEPIDKQLEIDYKLFNCGLNGFNHCKTYLAEIEFGNHPTECNKWRVPDNNFTHFVRFKYPRKMGFDIRDIVKEVRFKPDGFTEVSHNDGSDPRRNVRARKDEMNRTYNQDKKYITATIFFKQELNIPNMVVSYETNFKKVDNKNQFFKFQTTHVPLNVRTEQTRLRKARTQIQGQQAQPLVQFGAAIEE